MPPQILIKAASAHKIHVARTQYVLDNNLRFIGLYRQSQLSLYIGRASIFRIHHMVHLYHVLLHLGSYSIGAPQNRTSKHT
jgi:hypothetical protein